MEENRIEEEEIFTKRQKKGIGLGILGLVGVGIVGVGAKIVLKLSEPRMRFKKIDSLITEIEKSTVELNEMKVDIESFVAINGSGGLDKELNKLKSPEQLVKDILFSIIDVEEKILEIFSTNKTNDEIIRCLYKVLDRYKGQIKAYKTRYKFIKKALK